MNDNFIDKIWIVLHQEYIARDGDNEQLPKTIDARQD